MAQLINAYALLVELSPTKPDLSWELDDFIADSDWNLEDFLDFDTELDALFVDTLF